MKWSDEYRVHYYYTDYNNVLKPAYIGRYMQETAWNALKNWGPSPAYLYEKKLAFILTKISFRYYGQIREDEIIKVETWANPPKTVVFPRHYRIYRGGETAVEAVSEWVLLDTEGKNILRPADYSEVLTAYDGEEPGFTVQKRIKMPENMDAAAEYTVGYSDIDTNFHMNNARYIDLICDNLYSPEDTISPFLQKRLISLDINYTGEARFAQTIAINKGVVSGDGGAPVRTEEHYMKAKIKNGGQNCFEAKIAIAPENGQEGRGE
ncbi:MAG: thioesterase [Oscillospiraceae bacterium]|nr:thioesterase [Oscillospiraceae bacterium]